MQIEAIRRPFSVEEYNRMVEAGILGKEDRVELIEGEILEMSPIGSRHMACVDRAAVLLLEHRNDYYAPSEAVTRNAFLVIEVSDSSIRYDRGPKLRVYARHAVSEVWIEDLTTDTLLVFREPEGGAYKTQITFHPGEFVSPQAFPKLVLPVSSLLNLDFET
jgi:Uma2 family endonuclease